MAKDDNNLNIMIRLADVEPTALTIPRDEEANYREAEKLVNTLWNKWIERFDGDDASKRVMAMVAFQFARLYSKAYNQNVAVNKYLTDFEQQLNDVVVKI
ncbi:MAG: cell division protein ZapA [Muribaculaceae bacterium]|nr:cell division protein ZapA [Muribaculaceae bacterium]MBR5117524.1 cell division protein ZapA [Muribaculaceae bacterium]